MSDLLFIAIPADKELNENLQLSWFHQSEKENIHGTNTLSRLKELFPSTSYIGVLSGEKVFETQSELRIKNRKQLEQAISYDLEEQLAAEVDTLHFAYQKNAEKNLDISVIDKAYLEELIHFFSDYEISLQQLLSETILLSYAPENCLIIHHDQRCLLKVGKQCYNMDTENLILSLELLPEEFALPESTPVYTSSTFHLESSLTTFLSTKIDHYFAQICQYYPTTPPLNILQGHYQAKTVKTWRLIFAIGLASLLLFSSLCCYQLYQNNQLQLQEENLEKKIISIYKQSFPKARRIIDPVSQMRFKLKKLTSSQTQNGDFIPLLAKVARVIHQQADFKLKQLNFQKQALTITFSSSSLAKLENFKNDLIKTKLQAKISSVNKEENRVIAHIIITGAHS
jgi:general secretion pathway protein L